MNDISLTPVRIHDAGRLRESVFCDMKLQDISTFIRDSISDASRCIYVASKSSPSGQDVVGLVGLNGIHEVNHNAFIYCRFAKFDSMSEEEASAIQINAVDSILRIAFFSMQLHKVSWTIRITDFFAGEIAMKCGMRQEAVLEEALCEEDIYVDAGLFSLLASEYPDYSVAFVYFPKGVIAIRGSSSYVEGVRFYSVGERIEDPFDKRVAIRTGVADESGTILSEHNSRSSEAVIHLPGELSKAARELKEYLKKSRTKFSVSVNFPYGSDFQRHVWQEIQRIPYGTTVSYEDIAMALTGNDKVAARNLSRAVGSACSDNPIPILIPCHRVIGKDGKLVGFSSGVENKEFLLEHEIFGFFREVSATGTNGGETK
jgi:O-6-methylguanine DNA methyltransferase